MTKNRQIVFIHGGDAFRDSEKLYAAIRARTFNPYDEKQKWRDSISAALAESHESHIIRMPNSLWADYTAWSLWFAKMIPFLRDDLVLVGHSLGGGFLLRFLSENQLPVSVAQLHLVAPVVTSDLEDCEGFTIDPTTWNGFASSIHQVHLWHSQDDPLVPITHSEQVVALVPEATLHTFTDRGHFLQPEFPELLAEIQKA